MRDFTQELATMEAALQIDEHKLDDCLVEQPQLYWDVAKRHAIAVSDRDGAKKTLLDMEAEVDTETRSLARSRDERTTEKEIESIKRTDIRVEHATRKFMNLNHEMLLLDALKAAFQMRSYILKDLVQLYIAHYYEEASQDKVQRIRRDGKVEKRREEIAKNYSIAKRYSSC